MFSDIEKTLKQIFVDVFPNMSENSFDFDKQQNDYENWDSFAHLRLVSEIEEKFNIKLEIDDVIYINSASGFLKLIKEKSSVE